MDTIMDLLFLMHPPFYPELKNKTTIKIKNVFPHFAFSAPSS